MSIKFFRRFFLSHSAEIFHFLGEAFNVSQISVIENKLSFRGLRQYFLSRFLLSHAAENVLRCTLLCLVSYFFWWRKCLWIREGGYQDFPDKFFVSQCGKDHFVGESLSVSLILGNEKVYG